MKNNCRALLLIIITIFSFITPSFAQKKDTTGIEFSWTDKLKLAGSDINIETFKFYISNLELRYKGNTVYKDKSIGRLIDFHDLNSTIIHLNKENEIKFDELKFDIGIDSVTNSLGVQEGDLDPMNGMYWSWQSGYINIKIEGTYPNLTTYKNKFQYHLGGYLENQYAIQELSFKNISSSNPLIEIHLTDFFKDLNILEEHSVMIPGSKAIGLSSVFKKCFVLK